MGRGVEKKENVMGAGVKGIQVMLRNKRAKYVNHGVNITEIMRPKLL